MTQILMKVKSKEEELASVGDNRSSLQIKYVRNPVYQIAHRTKTWEQESSSASCLNAVLVGSSNLVSDK